MSDKKFGPTIEKCPHDKDHPYTMVLNSLIRDNSISPNCRLILIYLLSHKSGWRINTSQIYHEFKGHLGRDKILKILNEAIEVGYMKREDYKEGNLRRFRYFLSEIPKFKNSFLSPDLKGPEDKGCIERSFNSNKENNDNVSKARQSEDEQSLEDRSSFSENQDRSFDPFKYKMPNGNKLSLRMARSLSKYSDKDKQKLYANIAYFEEKIKTGLKPDNPEAYLQSCIKNNYAGKEETSWKNKIYASWAKEEYRLTNLKILKTVAKIKSKGCGKDDSISFNISEDEFIKIIDKYIEKEK